MILRQILNVDLGCASYLIADPDAGVAAVVDPRADVAEYLATATDLGVRITDVVETHNHADHVSGRPELIERTGATAHIHRLAEARYRHRSLEDGDVLAIGGAHLAILHTPGHRPEHCSVVVRDVSAGSDPVAVLTGDSLFVGDVARPDLAVEPREGARELFQSLERLAALPDAVEVLPAHIGGSLCGSARMSTDTRSTIGAQRTANAMFAERDAAEFVDELVSGLAPQPPNFRRIVARNRGPIEIHNEAPVRVSAADVPGLQAAGASVIDGRGAEAFDRGHIRGAIGVPADLTGFGTKVAWVVDPDVPVMLVAAGEDQAGRMAEALRAVAVDRPLVLEGGSGDLELQAVPTMSATELDGEVQLLDVRERDEWEEFRIPGSINVPYHELTEAPSALDPARPVACICTTGMRSGIAVGLLQRLGFEVVHVTDGIGAWRDA